MVANSEQSYRIPREKPNFIYAFPSRSNNERNHCYNYFWTMQNTYGIFLVSLQKNKLNMKKIRLTCPECGCEDIKIVEDRYVRCTACGFEDDVEVFIS